MDWYVLQTEDGQVRQRSYEQEPVKHSVFSELPLMNSLHEPIHKYAFYVQLLTDSAWRVPVLHGKLAR